MRKTLASLMAAMLMAACATKTADTPTATGIAATSIDVEALIDSIDLDMDLTGLPLSDLRILRNAFAARQGYPFKDAYIRGVFETTTWYDSLVWRFDDADNFIDIDWEGMSWREAYYSAIKPDALKFSQAELAFMDRVKQREQELMKHNYDAPDGMRVNMANVVNPAQLLSMDAHLCERLGANGFAIVPERHEQLFHVYEQNDYHNFPSFVTTDLFLQLYHLFTDCMLREVEQHRLMPMLDTLCLTVMDSIGARLTHAADPQTRDAAEWSLAYFAIARHLLSPSSQSVARLPQALRSMAEQELANIREARNSLSEFLGYEDVEFEYSLFSPRGHYTRTDSLRRYFQAMMWLQTAPMHTDRPEHMRRALLLADVMRSSARLGTLYRNLTEPMTHLMGRPDDVSIAQVAALMDADGVSLSQALADETVFGRLVAEINSLAAKQTRIKPHFQRTSMYKVRLMPQRYQPDAEVLQEMVDYESDVTRRATPQGLDILAAMGNTAAEDILIREQKEDQRWKDFVPTLARMKARMDSVDWSENMATGWLSALNQLKTVAQGSPYFMLTTEWQRKQMNTALASWAEMKHDAILYAKQPMGAECGGGGPPPPVVNGFVEPCTAFWSKAIELLGTTDAVLKAYGLHTPKTMRAVERLTDEAQFLLGISQKELAGTMPTDEEMDQLKFIGATFENMSVDLIRSHDQQLYEWNDVQGPDRSVAVVADVYTANADNNPNASVLYAAVGTGDDIYVVVEFRGYLYLTRGAVLSYRELTRPYGEQRLNDELWQQRLTTDPRTGLPEWMKPIMAEPEEKLTDNEGVFYSSGC